MHAQQLFWGLLSTVDWAIWALACIMHFLCLCCCPLGVVVSVGSVCLFLIEMFNCAIASACMRMHVSKVWVVVNASRIVFGVRPCEMPLVLHPVFLSGQVVGSGACTPLLGGCGGYC